MKTKNISLIIQHWMEKRKLNTKAKSIKILIIFVAMYLATIAQAAIYIDGQLYSGNVLNITDSSYNYPNGPILVTGNSIVNLYSVQQGVFDDPSPCIALTENSVMNMYYEDDYVVTGSEGFYRPGFQFGLMAQGDSVVNFIIPENDVFSFYLWDTEDYLPSNYLDVYAGLQINRLNYPSASYAELYRYYGPGVPQVLTPGIGNLQLQNDAVMNFVPEPATVLLFGIGGLFIRRKVQ